MGAQGLVMKGMWSSIVSYVVKLQDRHTILLANLNKKVSDGRSTLFWKEVWVGNVALRYVFLSLLALKTNYDCMIVDRRENQRWSWNWWWRIELRGF